jgi:hypothetical protein
VSLVENVPAETRAKVEEVKKGLLDGSFVMGCTASDQLSVGGFLFF